MRLSAEKGRLDRTLSGAELELAEAQRQIHLLEVLPLPTQPLTPSLSLVLDPTPTPRLSARQSVRRVANSSPSPGPPTSQPILEGAALRFQRVGSSPKQREKRC